MKTIDVREQPRLGAHRTLEICLNGVRYRLFRSIITVVVIAVAIAFMMNILCEGLSTRAVGQAARVRTERQRLAAFWSARLSVAATTEDILREVAAAEPGSALRREAQTMGGLDDAAFAGYVRGAADASLYLGYFADLRAGNYAKLRALVRDAAGTTIFDRLQDPEARQRFGEQLSLVKLRLPGAPGDFGDFLGRWPALQQQTAVIRTAREAGVARFATALRGTSITRALAEADGPGGDAVVAAGFTAFDAPTRAIVAEQARIVLDQERLLSCLDNTKVRGALAAQFNVLPGDLNATRLWKYLASPRNAGQYLTLVDNLNRKDAKAKPVFDTSGLAADRIATAAGAKVEQASLQTMLQRTTEDKGGLLGLGTRMTWLVLISMLVCVVGISNAMLMSVTERFREIATLKCLGALDGFIMLLFVMEAGILGFAGGLIGALAGSLIGFGRMGLAFGGVLFNAFPTLPWLGAMGLAVLVGVVLAAVAGMYPSYVAARLAPMEAMRIE